LNLWCYYLLTSLVLVFKLVVLKISNNLNERLEIFFKKRNTPGDTEIETDLIDFYIIYIA